MIWSHFSVSMRYQSILSVFSAIRCISEAVIKSKFHWKKGYRHQMAHLSSFPPPGSSSSSISVNATEEAVSSDNGYGFRMPGSSFVEKKRIQWHRNDFLVVEDAQTNAVTSRYGLVMTNSETMDATLARRWWSMCEYKICADGGANRLFDGLSDEASRYIPDMVKGDLDSLRDDVSEFYAAAGCAVVRDRDQDHNDLDKCLQTLQKHWYIDHSTASTPADTPGKPLPASSSSSPSSSSASSSEVKPRLPTTVIILGAFGGRFDQEIASIHALYKWRAAFDRVVLVGGGNVACLLDPGTHRLDPVDGEGPTCALLPVGGPVRSITTRGLQWDMADQRMELGGLVSSSNSLLPVESGGFETDGSNLASPDTATTPTMAAATGAARTIESATLGDVEAEMILGTEVDTDTSRPLGAVGGAVGVTKKKGQGLGRYQTVLVETSDPVLWMTTTAI